MTDALALATPAPVKRRLNHPKGWEPSLEQCGDIAKGVSEPFPDGGATPDEAAIIAGWGLDADEWAIVGSINVRRWQQEPGGDWLRYFKCDLRRRTHGDTADIEALVRIAERGKPAKIATLNPDGPAFVVSLNDWQIGKGEGGGSEAIVERVLAAIEACKGRLRELKRIGRAPSKIVLANTGDLIERVSGNYPSQAFTVDLNEREQLKLARRLVFRFVDELVGMGYPVVVTAVPCNHGENRNGSGKNQTTADDNVSLTIVETVEEACSVNPDRYGNVTFAYAPDLTLVMDIAGVNVGMTHGHQMRGSGPGAAVLEKWWMGQIMGNCAVATADLLLCAHRHHLQISEETGRTVMLAPAMDGGSYWYTSATGRSSPPGMLTFGCGEYYHRGWGDMAVL